MCDYLKRIGLDVRLLNHNGHSALHKAAVKGQQGACQWLLDDGGLGLEHMAPDSDGNTPAEMARLEGFADLAAWLQHRESALRSQHSSEAQVENG